ncbi:MAG: LON peptidase substrate-binding domain-containing protein, partial [Phycisphaerae bacterium]|nr:LON peptidase substrate-binding domain-containing protein [Phycisphaerae bacterium]
MGEYLKNLLFIHNSSWNVMLADENGFVTDIPEKSSQPDEEIITMPDTIGILSVRNAVIYPGTVSPLAVGRERSRNLLENIKPNETIIGLVTQKNADMEKPGFSDLHTIGTAATILKVIKMPQGSVHVVVHGVNRFKIITPVTEDPYLKAQVRYLKAEVKMTKNLQALMVSVRRAANRVIALSPNVPEEASVLLENIDSPSALADFLAANLNLEITKKQQLLEELDAQKRLEMISLELARQLDVLELSHKIQGKVRDSVEKNQREYFLQEQLKAIQSELGEGDRRNEELKQLKENIKKAKMPKKVEEETLHELDRLSRIPQMSPEHSVIRTYLDWVCELPWSIQTKDQLDINRAEKILKDDHYGLEKIKKRILEFLAVRKLNP